MHSGMKIGFISIAVIAIGVSGFSGYLKHKGAIPASVAPAERPQEPAQSAPSPAEAIEELPEPVQELAEPAVYIRKDISDRSPTDFVDIRDMDENIIVEPIFLQMPLMTGKDEEAKYSIVQTYEKTVLRKATAEKLKAANDLAMEKYGCRIRVFEGYRGIEVQKALREHFVNTAPKELQSRASTYIASPGHSKHQSGVAVDLTLVDMETGEPLEMPSDYLAFSLDASAHPDAAKCDAEAFANVKKLQDVMVASGFEIYNGEWWHFNDVETLKKVKCEVISPDDY